MRTVLLHGFTGGAGSFAHLGHHTFDLPGHGEAPPASSWEAALSMLEPRLLGDGPLLLCGYSLGARLALALALRRPPAHLVLLSGTAGIRDAHERATRLRDDARLADALERDGLPAFLQQWERNPVLQRELPPELDAQVRKERLRNTAASLASALRSLGAGAQPSYWDRLGELRTRVTLVTGARDEKFTSLGRELQARIAGARLLVLDQCGHAPHLEQPSAVKQLLEEA